MQIARNNFFTTRSNAMKNWEDNELLQNHNYDYIVMSTIGGQPEKSTKTVVSKNVSSLF